MFPLYTVANDISDEEKEKVSSIGGNRSNISIRFVQIDSDLANMDYSFREGYSAESFYRVILMELLPQYDKILYLDCDVVALQDIAQLYAIDLGDSLAAAVPDPDGIKCYYQNYHNRALYMDAILKLTKPDNYFQSGVMLLQLDNLRKTYDLHDVLRVACSPDLVWGDQDALNILCKDRVHYLNMEWNTIVDGYGGRVRDVSEWAPDDIKNAYLKARENPRIVHYAGVQPWKDPNVDMNEYFWTVAKSSPYFDTICDRVKENRSLLGQPKPRIVTGAKFAVSVIIPIYNAETTLEETIQCVVDQTIGFRKYIQLILVNNATLDNSENICLKYAEQYPQNIKG